MAWMAFLVMVLSRIQVDFYSMCEHHMMPFFGKYWFAYIPNPKVRY